MSYDKFIGILLNKIERLMRSENQNKISTQLSDICELLSESCTWAKMEGAKVVTSDNISVLDLLNVDNLVMSKASIKTVEEALK